MLFQCCGWRRDTELGVDNMICPKCKIIMSYDGKVHECDICGYKQQIGLELHWAAVMWARFLFRYLPFVAKAFLKRYERKYPRSYNKMMREEFR